MFDPPKRLKPELFAKIPEHLHVRERASQWVKVQQHGSPTPVFLEGPSFDRDGNLWVVDIPWGRLFKINPRGDVTLELEYDGEPNGLKFHRDGRAFIADYRHGIMVFDPTTGKIEPYFERPTLERFKGCNDLFFASNGDLYFTDQGQTGLHDPTGRLYRLRTDGRLDCVLNNVPSPNGLVLNADETAVYGACRCWPTAPRRRSASICRCRAAAARTVSRSTRTAVSRSVMSASARCGSSARKANRCTGSTRRTR
jgi:gluconolactonase